MVALAVLESAVAEQRATHPAPVLPHTGDRFPARWLRHDRRDQAGGSAPAGLQ